MRKSIMYVGMDQHKESIEIATADEGRDGEVRRYGRIDGELHSLDRVVRKLVSTGKELRFVYEAGACGLSPKREREICPPLPQVVLTSLARSVPLN